MHRAFHGLCSTGTVDLTRSLVMIRHAISFSSGIRALRHIRFFLGVDSVSPPRIMKSSEIDATCVLVWGRKENSKRPRDWADLHSLPVWFLEDGFIRSSSENPHSRTTYSLVMDDVGVYYDANCTNRLENFLNEDDETFAQTYDQEIEAYTQRCLAKLRQNRITKYNFCRDFEVPASWYDNVLPMDTSKRRVVLVVDQTYDDASVTHGCMSKDDFIDMLDSAIAENPDSHIVVKTHPDVTAGLKKGYLSEVARSRGIEVLSTPANSLSVIEHCERVYVGTSQMGFEALLCGKAVSVFGLPFYAGWGATDDRKTIPRRKRKRTVEQLFFAAYDWYTRYVNPVTAERWTLEQCLDHIVLQKKEFERNAREFHAIGITPWKRKYVSQFLRSPNGSVSYHSSSGSLSSSLQRSAESALLTWSYRDQHMRALRGTSSGLSGPVRPIYRIEDGFLRGRGLGSDYTAPQSLVIDSGGLYFNPQQASDLECLLNTHDCSLAQIQRATRLKKLIISAGLSKYNVGSNSENSVFANAQTQKQGQAIESNRNILIVGQVENDASLRYGCSDIATNSQLITVVRAGNPDACIAFKPHPDVVAGNRTGVVDEEVLANNVDVVCQDINIISCIEQCDEVHTMTSLSGFEALMRGKSVVTYGLPFYAGWGLTRDHRTISRRTRNRTLEELIYCVLIAYPKYLDISTGEFITPEDLVTSLCDTSHMKNKNITWPERQLLKVKNVYKGLSYAP